MKRLIFIILAVSSCTFQVDNDSELIAQLDSTTETINCHIKYLDAIFLNQSNFCNKLSPILISESDSYSPRTDTEVWQVISYLDSICNRKTKFEFNLGYTGARIMNYSDSLYFHERSNWIKRYKNITTHNM